MKAPPLVVEAALMASHHRYHRQDYRARRTAAAAVKEQAVHRRGREPRMGPSTVEK